MVLEDEKAWEKARGSHKMTRNSQEMVVKWHEMGEMLHNSHEMGEKCHKTGQKTVWRG